MIRRILRHRPKYENKEEIILRDHLALERTKLANERTLLSFLRTSLYLVLGGIAFLQLNDFGNTKIFGWVSLMLSAVLIVIGVYRYRRLRRELSRFYTERNSEPQVRSQE